MTGSGTLNDYRCLPPPFCLLGRKPAGWTPPPGSVQHSFAFSDFPFSVSPVSCFGRLAMNCIFWVQASGPYKSEVRGVPNRTGPEHGPPCPCLCHPAFRPASPCVWAGEQQRGAQGPVPTKIASQRTNTHQSYPFCIFANDKCIFGWSIIQPIQCLRYDMV